MRLDQPTWPIFSWQGAGCSDSKTYASKILSLRLPAFFFFPAPQHFNLYAPLHPCRQGLQAAALKWQIWMDTPNGAGTLALVCQWVREGLGKRGLSPCPHVVSAGVVKGQQWPSWTKLENAALTNSGIQKGVCFETAAWSWFSCFAGLEMLPRGLWDPASVSSPWHSAGVSVLKVSIALSPSRANRMCCAKWSCSGVPLSCCKEDELGSAEILLRIFCWKRISL